MARAYIVTTADNETHRVFAIDPKNARAIVEQRDLTVAVLRVEPAR